MTFEIRISCLLLLKGIIAGELGAGLRPFLGAGYPDHVVQQPEWLPQSPVNLRIGRSSPHLLLDTLIGEENHQR